MILQLTYGKGGALLMGDASTADEKQLCDAYGKTLLQSQLLSVGQHGSGNATSNALLDAVSPCYAVVSCGAGNMYGHPTGELLARLDAAEVCVMRTDRLGEIVFESDGDAFYIPDDGDE